MSGLPVTACMLFITCLIYCQSTYSTVQDNQDWNYYKTHFIKPSGRVIDTQKDNTSHSEGQGYSLLLSVFFNDKEIFDKVYSWTKNNLENNQTGLYSWHWGADSNGLNRVLDTNNATDGDILITWALGLANKKWKIKKYKIQAKKMQQIIINQLMTKHRNHYFLLPGKYGFISGRDITINPSYLVFPAYSDLSEWYGGAWPRLNIDSRWLLKESQQSDIGLPNDWVTIDTAYSQFSADGNFSVEAIRVWLYMALDDNQEFYPGFKQWMKFYHDNGYLPHAYDPDKKSFSGYAMAGFYGVTARVLYKQGDIKLASKLWSTGREKMRRDPINYYSSVLYLLSRIDLHP